MKPRIIATISNDDFSPEYTAIKHLVKNDITYFRFNLSKYDNVDKINDRCEYIYGVKQYFGAGIQIMLDLPLPRRKPRLTISDGSKMVTMRAGDTIIVSSATNTSNAKVLRIDDETILSDAFIGQEIVYSDGECCFMVSDIDRIEGIIKLTVKNDCDIYNRKSLSYGHTIDNSELKPLYFDAIDTILPDSVALSFVESSNDLTDIAQRFEGKNIKIISKIENHSAVKNLEDILKYSHAMLARGDLLLNLGSANFYRLHNYIVEKVKNSGKQLYVATGIMSSMRGRYIPMQSDLIDLGTILTANPYAIILNSGVAYGNIEITTDIIKQMAIVYDHTQIHRNML